MDQSFLSQVKLEPLPEISLLRMFQRRVRAGSFYLILLLLILFGLYGLFSYLTGFEKIFFLSLLTDCFVFYLWRRQKEKVKMIASLPRPGQEVVLEEYLGADARQALEKAWLACYRHGFKFLRPIHLLKIFVKDKEFEKVLRRLSCQPKQVLEKVARALENPLFIGESERGVGAVDWAPDFKEIFVSAYLFCLANNRPRIGSLELLWAIGRQENLVRLVFDEFGISPQEIERVILWARLEKQIQENEQSFFWQRLFKPKGKLNRVMTAALTPLLDRVSRDLTFLAKKGEFEMVVARDKEVNEIINHFAGGRYGVVLVGEGKIGKTAVLKKLAQLMVAEEVPDFLRDKRLVELDIGALAGVGEQGEEYLKQICFEVSRAGNIILVIDNLDSLAGFKTQPAGLDLAEILASALEKDPFYFIGTALPAGFANKIEGKILGETLASVEVALPDKDLLWQILIAKIFIIEKELKILFTVDALERAIVLADQYFYGKTLPGKAIDLLTESAYAAIEKKGKRAMVEESDVAAMVEKKTKIPVGQLQASEKQRLLRMEELLHERMVDQDEAVSAVADALRRSRLAGGERKRPICNFLFIGPTGVGKTELAKSLAAVYFYDEKRMIRLDMSEYQEKRALRNLIGLQTDEATRKGFLTEAVKRQPYSLLLLDEIEKAHPDILNLFLQVMDDGRLTDASGETINFSNVILIATSNAGTKEVQEKIKQKIPYDLIYLELKERILLDYFRPEYLNRFDKIVLFKTLSLEDVAQIAKLMLAGFAKKMAEQGIFFESEDEATAELARLGYDPLYGARPLRRVIQEKVETQAAKILLEDRVRRRDTLVLRKGLVLEVKKAVEI